MAYADWHKQVNHKMNKMRDNQKEAVGAAHSPQSHIKVGITHGDTNGVGYELIFQTFGNPTMFEVCTPIVYGAPQIANAHKKAFEGYKSIIKSVGDS